MRAEVVDAIGMRPVEDRFNLENALRIPPEAYPRDVMRLDGA